MIQPHVTRVRVRYAETDRMDRVHHMHYLSYFEVGRVEYLREAGFRYRALEEEGFRLAVAEVRCRYLAGARYDDLLRVETSLTEVTGARIRFHYGIYRESDGARLAQGETTLACLQHQGRPTRIPERIRALLLATVASGQSPSLQDTQQGDLDG